MAEAIHQQCSICLGSPKNAVRIPCLHFFCRGCLQRWIDQTQRQDSCFQCPVCRYTHNVPEIGISAFPKAFVTNIYPYKYCNLHSRKQLKLFCKECEKAICVTCKDTEHSTHTIEKLINVLRYRQNFLKLSLNELQLNSKKFKSVSESLKKKAETIPGRKRGDIKKVRQQAKRIKEIIDAFATNLERGIEKEYEEIQHSFDNSQQLVEKKQDDIETFINHSKFIVSSDDYENLLSDFNTLMDIKESVLHDNLPATSYQKEMFLNGEVNKEALKDMVGRLKPCRRYPVHTNDKPWFKSKPLPAIGSVLVNENSSTNLQISPEDFYV